jgi:predicted DsbA family dithiol-disulfide isomerase
MVPSPTNQSSEIDESIHMNGKHYFVTHHAVERSQQRMVRAGSHTGWGFVVKNIIQAYSTVEASRQIREIEQNGSVVHVTPDRWRFALTFESNNLVVLKTIFHEVYKNGFEDTKKMA